MKGPLAKYEGTPDTLASFLSGKLGFMDTMTKLKRVECKGILTEKRFVICPNVKWKMPIGPLLWFIFWLFKRKNILYSTPLSAITGVEEAKGQCIVVKTSGGPDVIITSDALFSTESKSREWARAIKSAISGDSGSK